jgi:hypothetical protein
VTHWLGPSYSPWYHAYTKHIWVRFKAEYHTIAGQDAYFMKRLACTVNLHNGKTADVHHAWVCWKDARSKYEEHIEQVHLKYLIPAVPREKSTAKKLMEVLIWEGEFADTIANPTHVPRGGAFTTADEAGEISFKLEGKVVKVPRKSVVMISDHRDAYRT